MRLKRHKNTTTAMLKKKREMSAVIWFAVRDLSNAEMLRAWQVVWIENRRLNIKQTKIWLCTICWPASLSDTVRARGSFVSGHLLCSASTMALQLHCRRQIHRATEMGSVGLTATSHMLRPFQYNTQKSRETPYNKNDTLFNFMKCIVGRKSYL